MINLNNLQGKFIVFEGIEGSGKSTNIDLLSKTINKLDIPFLLTNGIGSTNIGRHIREILLNKINNILPETELLLFFAERSEHLNKIIIPSLKNNLCILCDRFTDTTYAYQGAGRGIDINKIHFLKKWIQQDVEPNLILLFDLPVEIALYRIKKRGLLDRIESENISFFKKIRKEYLKIARMNPKKYVIINANLPLEIVFKKVLSSLSNI